MDIMSAVLLGVVQGVTEFLPVSSTGHLVLTHALLGIEDSSSLAFDAILHLATAAAVIVYFFEEIMVLVQTVLRKLSRLPVNEKDFLFVKAILVGIIPAGVMGILFEDLISGAFRNPVVVAGVLVLGSFFFMYAEYIYQNNFHTGTIDVKTGLKIGFFQVLALIPGFSRSGATIAGGMVLGLSRTDAARFSFLLAVPLILGAGLKKLFELLSLEQDVAWLPIGVGALVSFVVGLLAIHFMISFVRKHTLWPFIWYRLVLAVFILYVSFFG